MKGIKSDASGGRRASWTSMKMAANVWQNVENIEITLSRSNQRQNG
jgi:hypothetical protein